MNAKWLDHYLGGWSRHCDGQDASASAMVEGASPGILYGDINLPDAFEGHEGVRQMCALASGLLPGALMVVKERIVADDAWVVRWELQGRAAEQDRTYAIHGTSWGSLDADGKVLSQTDYWNPGHYEVQVGKPLF